LDGFVLYSEFGLKAFQIQSIIFRRVRLNYTRPQSVVMNCEMKWTALVCGARDLVLLLCTLNVNKYLTAYSKKGWNQNKESVRPPFGSS
jgi:hypothetical protein